jgi:AraC family transcriptional regulator, chitin signaling transcriptional activator
MILKIVFFILFFLSSYLFSSAQEDYKITTYHASDIGLPTNLTKSIIQDTHGFIWTATDMGLVRFDGINFKTYNTNLKSNYTKFLFKRKNGDLLLIHDAGLVKIINKADTVLFEELIAGGEVTDSTLFYSKEIYETHKNVLWISEGRSSVVKYENGQLKRFEFSLENNTRSFYRSFIFIEDENKMLWTISQQGYLFYFDENKQEFKPYLLSKKLGQTNGMIYLDKQTLLVASEEGTYSIKLDNSKNNTEKLLSMPNIRTLYRTKNGDIYAGLYGKKAGFFHLIPTNKGLKAKEINKFLQKGVNSVTVDYENNIWVSSDHGIATLYIPPFKSIRSEETEEVYIDYIRQLNEKTYYCLSEGKLVRLDEKENNWEISTLFDKINEALSSIDIKGDTIWLGTNAALYRYVNNSLTKIDVGLGSNETLWNLMVDREGNVWFSKHNIYELYCYTNKKELKVYNKAKGIHTNIRIIKQLASGQIIAAGIGSSSYLYQYDPPSDTFKDLSKPSKNTKINDIGVHDFSLDSQGNIYLACTKGLFIWKANTDSIENIIYDNKSKNLSCRAVMVDQYGLVWIGTSSGLIKYSPNETIFYNDTEGGLVSRTVVHRGLSMDSKNRIWVATDNGVSYKNISEKNPTTNKVSILSVLINNKRSPVINNEIEIIKGSFLKVNYTSLTYPSDRLIFQYRLDKNDNWINLGKESTLYIPMLELGSFTLELRALREIGHTWSESSSIKLNVVRAWYESYFAFAAYFILLVALVAFIVRIYTYRLKKSHQLLENMVLERTSEINVQKEEIMQQRDTLISKSLEISKKNEEITDSINYAKRIQTVMLPSREQIQTSLPQSFIFFRPRDIVSGDFYWHTELKNNIVLVAADCTGHGVPGAFMSMIGMEMLNKIVIDNQILETGQILNHLHISIRKLLRQEYTDVNDGMDIAVCLIDKSNQKLFYSGAINPFIYIKDGVLTEIKGNRTPIGGKQRGNLRNFDTHEILLSRSTIQENKVYQSDINVSASADLIFYLFTDGYQDQFGGPHGRKFMTKKFRELLFSIHSLPIEEQENIISQTFDRWKEREKQIDDVLVMGIRISTYNY